MNIVKRLLICLFVFYGITAISQDYVTSENFKLKLIKAKKASGSTWEYTIKTSKQTKKAQVRLRLKSLTGQKESFDPNKFYLVSNEANVRVRPLDVRYNYAAGWIFIPFNRLAFNSMDAQKVKDLVSYDPDIKDTFQNYDIDGFENISPDINFGTKKKPKIFPSYLEPEDLKSCKLDLYFALPNELKNFEIYHGDEKIANVTLK
ncbi:hypothetical protein SAMN05192588_1391 [Nonlabens sp. Hel1_33_55]|uniref:hypothetical protein n=1 Tax=Nonlabens sp. Hel1_33_55 TaxID=1336802 RepID=UPI000875BE15|nr:hypothetical protein [Nonlabens sp. Hel1_33_55]SCY14985.1 hypothetical protein SAMN05192588_1391 [Nonlabens sp. Hel1_33_55]